MLKGYSLLLDDSWDLCVDAAGNLATTSEAYAIAQNVANAVRLFKNDAYFAQNKGIPHFDVELGQKESVALPILRTRVKKAAEEVEGVRNADVKLSLSSDEKRVLGGDIVITLDNGSTARIEF